MRIFIAIFLFIGLSLQLVVRLSVIALYEVNKDYIAKNLCENRAKPKMHCNGKCYLKKQLKKAEDSEKSNSPTSKSESFQFSAFVIPEFPECHNTVFNDVLVLQHKSQYRSIFGVNIMKDIFHPPQALA